MENGKKYFFGWTNIKWIIKEFIAMYSNTPSYFSKKRFESSIAYLSAIGVMLSYIYSHRATITNGEIWSDVALLFGIAGYAVKQIQDEKKLKSPDIDVTPTPEEPEIKEPEIK